MWYVGRNGRQEGPVTEEQLQAMVRDGSLQREDLVWRDGMANWQPAGTVPELNFSTAPAYVTPPPPPAAPPPSSPYAPPQAPYAPYTPPPAFGGAGADIPNYLPWAIAATLLCCMPGGIVSIIYASKANTAKARGDYAEASTAAGQAKTWLIISIVLGLAVSLVAILVNVANLANMK
jgi:hypothetical protein